MFLLNFPLLLTTYYQIKDDWITHGYYRTSTS